MRALLVVHRDRPEALGLANKAIAWLEQSGHRAVLVADDAAALGIGRLSAAASDIAQADVAVSLGGDGTMLRTVELVSAHGVPVIGVNVGRLGYLEEVEPAGLLAALESFAAGGCDIDERMMLSGTLTKADGVSRFRALNETVIEKVESGHTVLLGVTIDGTAFTSYAADGLIVATPTGSTAYSLSARGPIVSPRCEALLLTPVSPHMLFDRSMILAPDEEIAIEVLGHRPASVTVDGRPLGVLQPGDRVACRRATPPARFVRFAPRSFHQVLKAKFGLNDR